MMENRIFRSIFLSAMVSREASANDPSLNLMYSYMIDVSDEDVVILVATVWNGKEFYRYVFGVGQHDIAIVVYDGQQNNIFGREMKNAEEVEPVLFMMNTVVDIHDLDDCTLYDTLQRLYSQWHVEKDETTEKTVV